MAATIPNEGSTRNSELGTRNWHERVFFGLHYDLHASMRDTELGRDVTPEMLRVAWERIRPDWVQCDCKGHPGITSWPTRVGYASPGIVRDALRIHRDVTAELGIPLVMHYSGLWDEAAIHHHSDWARVNADGSRDARHVCPRSAYLTELMIPQMLELVDDYDVDGFWVDGDIWVARPCYCRRCRTAFTAATGVSEPPRGPQRVAPTGASPEALWPLWLTFHRRSYEDYARQYVEAIHARKPTCLVCINWLYSVRHPDPVSIPVGFISGDFSHAWGLERAMAEARVLASRGLPWDLMAWSFTTGESERAGWHTKTAAHLCQEASEVIANGGATCVYVHPPRSGHLVSWEHDVLTEVAEFCRARQAVAAGSQSVPQAVVLHGQSTYYAHNEPLYGFGQANQAVEGALHALLDAGYHVDIHNEDDLRARLADYRLVVVPEQDRLPDDLIDALADYVTGGGRLVLSGAHLAYHPELARLAGVEPTGDLREDFHYLPVDSAAVTVSGPWQPVRVAGAEAITALLSDREPGKHDTRSAAVTLRLVGQGQVVAVHGPIFAAYYRTRYPRLRALLRGLFRRLWPDPDVAVDADGPVHLTLQRRSRGTVVHLLNRGANPPLSPRNVMVERVPPFGPVQVRLRLPQRPQAVRLVPEAGTPVEWDWRDGWLTARLAQLGIHAALVAEGETGP